MRGWRSAFTLIELVVVMAIMVIMGALAPMITSGVVLERQMYNTAAQLQQDLLLVQNQSVTYSTDPAAHPSDAAARLFEIYFDTSNRRYFVESTADAVFNSPTSMIGKVLTRQLSSAMKLSLDSALTGAGGSISFNNQGVPYPTSGGVITVSNASSSKALTVTVSVIGRVTIK